MPDNRRLDRKKGVSLSEPYPKPAVERENRFYAGLLLEDYAGAAGEITAITQYIYHSITLKNEDYDVAELARQVAMTEMRHFALLGTTIQLLGSDPFIQCPKNNTTDFWSAKCIYYGDEVVDKLSADIAHEAAAIRNYQLHKKVIDDPHIRELLERIIVDEEHHLRLFQEAKARVCCKYY